MQRCEFLSPRRLASLALGMSSAGLLAVIWAFFLLVPYATIPDKNVFWVAFLSWALPFVIVAWEVRNKSPKGLNRLLSDVIVAVGFSIGATFFLQNRWSLLHSALLAAMPGVLTGVLVGVDSLLLPRIFKGQIGPGC